MSTKAGLFRGFSTRMLLACVVLGAFSGVLVHAARFLGLVMQATVPWLAYPAPIPWYLGILIAPLLTQRAGAALLSSVVATIAGFGALALCVGIIIEVAFFATGATRGRDLAPPRALYWLWWALGVSVLISLMNFGFMFLYQEFQLLEGGVKVLAVVARLVLGVIYAWLAWYITIVLLRANVNPSRLEGV